MDPVQNARPRLPKQMLIGCMAKQELCCPSSIAHRACRKANVLANKELLAAHLRPGGAQAREQPSGRLRDLGLLCAEEPHELLQTRRCVDRADVCGRRLQSRSGSDFVAEVRQSQLCTICQAMVTAPISPSCESSCFDQAIARWPSTQR